jgi:hypothetical protein
MEIISDEITGNIAPCGLHCGKCFAYSNGEIHKNSIELKNALGNFDVYARRFETLLEEPAFKRYPDFKEFLAYLTTTQCKGCRKELCRLFKDCRVRDCHKNKNVDFCYLCSDFPCSSTGFDDHLYKRFVDINLKIREIGIENYYDEVKNKSRY